MTDFEEKVNQCLVAANLTMPLLAKKAGLPEPELRAMCQRSDPRVSELEKLAHCLRVDPAYFLPSITQGGTFNQAGSGNIQKIKIGKAAAHQLVAQLNVCQHALDMANRLVAAKEEIIDLLRATYNRPN